MVDTARRPVWPTLTPWRPAIASMWRAAAAYRVASLAVCLYLIARAWDDYRRPEVALGVGLAMTVVTIGIVWLALTGRAHRPAVVGADVIVTAALTLATIAAQTPAQRHGGLSTLTTIWAAGPLLEAALLLAVPGGVVAAAVQLGAAVIVRDGYDGGTVDSAILLLLAGVITGYAVSLLRTAEARLARSVAAQAALEEREQLAREIHDDVLQVLALVHRDGAAAGGDWARLADAAADAEAALRRLAVARAGANDATDLADRLRTLGSARVTVSTSPRLGLPARAGEELFAAVRAALDNVAGHAGPDARAWVFAERTDHEVRIHIRDDGVGFIDTRLAAAQRAGRLGVAQSIRGRVAQVGGHCSISSAPGVGTEIEIIIGV
jgi:signal transduction histidine kinase